MKKFRNESYLKHFPFLSELGLENSDISVKRLDENILRMSFQDSYHDGSMGSDETKYKIWFVLKDNQIIENPVKIGDQFHSNYAHSESWDKPGECLAEAIAGYEEMLKYVVVHCSGYSNWNEQEEWNDTTIYKLPKGETIEDIINRFKIEQDNIVKREVSF